MLSQQHLWMESAATLAETAIPTNPSSLTLALIGVVFFVSYFHLARPGHQQLRRKLRIDSAQPTVTGPQIKPRRRVA